MSPFLDQALSSPKIRTAFFRASKVPIVSRLQRAVARAVVPPGTHRTVILQSGINAGLTLTVDPRSELGYLRGDHEPWLQDLLRTWLKPGAVFFDVGSHAGFFSVAAARLVQPNGLVIAIEPDARTSERVRQHAAQNHLSNIEVISAAAWSESTRLSFQSSTGTDAGVRGTVLVEEALSTTVTVDAIEIDDLPYSPDVVKMDVEGAEVEALQGAKSRLADRRTKWIVEVHSPELRSQVAERFRSAGYAIREEQPRHAVYEDYGQDFVVAAPTADALP